MICRSSLFFTIEMLLAIIAKMRSIIDQMRPEFAQRDQIRDILHDCEYFRTIPADVCGIIRDMLPSLRKSHNLHKIREDFRNFMQKYQKTGDSLPIFATNPLNPTRPQWHVLDLNKIIADFPHCNHLTSHDWIDIKQIGTHIIIDANTNSSGCENQYIGQEHDNLLFLRTKLIFAHGELMEPNRLLLSMNPNVIKYNDTGLPHYELNSTPVDKKWRCLAVLPCGLVYAEQHDEQSLFLVDFASKNHPNLITISQNVDKSLLDPNNTCIVNDCGEIMDIDRYDLSAVMFSSATSIFYSTIVM